MSSDNPELQTSPKRQKLTHEGITNQFVQFSTRDGTKTGPQMSIPVDTPPDKLQLILNDITKQDAKYAFFIDDVEIIYSVSDALKGRDMAHENVVTIIFQPKNVFRVRAVTRCTSSLPGHKEAILVVKFSPDSKLLATGSGDTTVRIWDLLTETPKYVLKGHSGWVQALEWNPNGTVLASGSMDSTIMFWNPSTGKSVRRALKGHKGAVMSLSWEPLHRNAECTRVCSAGKDSSIKVWGLKQSSAVMSLSGHTDAVTSVIWGGVGFIYSGSRDRTIRVWNDKTGELVRVLEGHGHWINQIALNTQHMLRHADYRNLEENESKLNISEAYNNYVSHTREVIVSASDDSTLFLWNPTVTTKPISRMTGHQQAVSFVSFSPDGHCISSASFDKSARLWDGRTGKYLSTLRGHAGAVYQVCWSADGRMIVTGSKDSTLKVWDCKKFKRSSELPGHADEVYAVDWSVDGKCVASGGKDTILKIWRY